MIDPFIRPTSSESSSDDDDSKVEEVRCITQQATIVDQTTTSNSIEQSLNNIEPSTIDSKFNNNQIINTQQSNINKENDNN